jgi:hypothetical protein
VGDRPSETPEMNDRALVDFLKVLVTLPSHAPHEGEALQRIAAEMRRLNYDDVTFDGDGNVIGRLGSGRLVLLLDGHVDTIPPHSIEAWTSPPLTAPERDGRVFGLGTVDNEASDCRIRARPSTPGAGADTARNGLRGLLTRRGGEGRRSPREHREADQAGLRHHRRTDCPSIVAPQRGGAKVEVQLKGRKA